MSIVSGTLFCSYGTVDSFFFQICVVDDLNGVHCSENDFVKTLTHLHDSILNNPYQVWREVADRHGRHGVEGQVLPVGARQRLRRSHLQWDEVQHHPQDHARPKGG